MTWDLASFVIGCVAGPIMVVAAFAAHEAIAGALRERAYTRSMRELCGSCYRRRAEHRPGDERCPGEPRYSDDLGQHWRARP